MPYEYILVPDLFYICYIRDGFAYPLWASSVTLLRYAPHSSSLNSVSIDANENQIATHSKPVGAVFHIAIVSASSIIPIPNLLSPLASAPAPSACARAHAHAYAHAASEFALAALPGIRNLI